MISPTPEAIASAMSAVCARITCDEDGDHQLGDSTVQLLHEVHRAAWTMRRRRGGVAGLESLNWMDLQKAAILEAIRRADGNYSKAAALLGVHFTTLYRWRREYGLEDRHE